MRISTFLPMLATLAGCDKKHIATSDLPIDAGQGGDTSPTPASESNVDCIDFDRDGYFSNCPPLDCGGLRGINNKLVHPGADEKCDGIDNNCDGYVDEGCPRNPAEREEEVVTRKWECEDGETRNCGVCDLGDQACEDGNWGECKIAPAEENEHWTLPEDCQCPSEIFGVLFIIDASAVMTVNNAYESVKIGFENYFSHNHPNIFFGMVLYPSPDEDSCSAGIALPIGSHPNLILERLNERSPIGSTPLRTPLELARRYLSDYSARDGIPMRNIFPLVLSCGFDFGCGDDEGSLRPLKAIGELGTHGGTVIEFNTEIIRPLAESENIRYYSMYPPANGLDLGRSIAEGFSGIYYGDSPDHNHQEICDGYDNNCDGIVDEGLQSYSYAGPAGTMGVGVCKPEIKDCVDGSMQIVQEEVNPTEEICDGFDNNCDGATDEGIILDEPCKPINLDSPCARMRSRTACGEEGAIICFTPEPTEEICNGIDDDCNGEIDDHCSN